MDLVVGLAVFVPSTFVGGVRALVAFVGASDMKETSDLHSVQGRWAKLTLDRLGVDTRLCKNYIGARGGG